VENSFFCGAQEEYQNECFFFLLFCSTQSTSSYTRGIQQQREADSSILRNFPHSHGIQGQLSVLSRPDQHSSLVELLECMDNVSQKYHYFHFFHHQKYGINCQSLGFQSIVLPIDAANSPFSSQAKNSSIESSREGTAHDEMQTRTKTAAWILLGREVRTIRIVSRYSYYAWVWNSNQSAGLVRCLIVNFLSQQDEIPTKRIETIPHQPVF